MTQKRWRSLIGVNLGAVLVGVLAFGVWQKTQPAPQAPHLEGTIVDGFDQIVDDVGYLPGLNYRVTAKRVADGRTIYDVVYTVDGNGFRVVPKADANPEACVLLFGDSFTFGEGLNDDQTFAADIVKMSAGKVQVYNLGQSGWSTNHFLAGLQSGRFEKAVPCTPTDAVYLILQDHVGRAVGRSPWDKHGPRYRMGPDGTPVRDGNFDSPGPPLFPQSDLDEGFLGWRRILLGKSSMGTPEEAKLAAAMLLAGNKELHRLWPKIRFHVIAWNPYDEVRLNEVLATLKAAGIDIRSLQAIIPDYLDHLDRYVIDTKYENHPNAAAHKLMAGYILHDIVGK
ncbi:MAG: SGNH/GDSL hydrolase family protein [Alphaproteobacteria bacterium]|nr:SGNH/GDSL hydrolase family protein [Alphaproteobacteria bacterium]